MNIKFHFIPVRSTPYATRTEGNIPLIKTKHETLKFLRKKYLISYDLPKILFLIFTILKELNLLQDSDSVWATWENINSNIVFKTH